jgi:O-antigen/teichoic acid export membrane protein
VLALSPHVSVVVLAARTRRAAGQPGPPARWREMRGRFGWLLVATLGAQALANLAAPAVRVLSSPREVEAAGNFLSALTIARIPLLLFAAVQAALLPRLVRAREAGDRREFGHQLRVVLLATAAVGLAGVAGVALLGPWVLRLLFGPQFGLPRGDLVLLALSAGVLMLGLALQSAVVALDDHRWSALSWVGGVLVLLVGFTVPLPVLLRVELALVVGALAVVALLGAAVLRHLSGAWVSSDSGTSGTPRG